MNEQTKDYFYNKIEKLLLRSTEEQRIDDVLYLLRELLDEL